MEQYDIALVGGDERIAYMQPYLTGRGYRVICYGTSPLSGETSVQQAESLEEAAKAGCLVAGIPFLKDGKINAKQQLDDLEIDSMYSCMRRGQTLFGGVLPGDFVSRCMRKGIICHDFMKDEALTVFNAIATAEGAILEALLRHKTNLQGSNSLVLGYGRCGKVLAEKLKGIGAKVAVCARNDVALANADAFGADVFHLRQLNHQIHNFEYVFNTVPAILLDEELSKRMREDVLVVDLASAPGGVDWACAKRLGIQALFCPGLPGKYAPKSSGERLADYVISQLGCKEN